MLIVGCDYSTKAVDLVQKFDHGWRHVKLHTRGLDETFVEELSKMLMAMRDWKQDESQPIIYIERPWIGMAGNQARTGNPMTSMSLIAISTAVQVCALLSGYRVEWAHPSSWRSKVFGKGKWPRDIAKARAVEWANANTGLDIDGDDNKADACCIAEYGWMVESA